MKILLVHNFYGSAAPSGENTAFLAESRLLRDHGHTVVEITRNSDEIRSQGSRGNVQGALSSPWNPFTKNRVRRIVEKEQPDILHVHNTFPLISPSVFYAASGSGTATVMTLHNYRIFCAAAVLLRDGSPCTECIDKKTVLPALRHGCYRGSRLATVSLAIEIALHRAMGTWKSKVDAFIALTEFQRQQLVEAGIPKDSIYVKPHCYPDALSPVPWDKREGKAVFIGRLGPEKGVSFLIDAWMKWGVDAPFLEGLGEGPERKTLERKAAARHPAGKVRFIGQLPFEEVQARLSHARMLVLPSVCYEGFPMVIREAFALGVPVAASRRGSLPYIVDDGNVGVLFAPGSSEDMLDVVKGVWGDRHTLEEMGKAARRKFESEYAADPNHDLLMRIYEDAISRRRKK
jgi:glycosyltransferase involved in cell wall biosynthesis